MCRIVIADFNTHCRQGQCLGHSFAVAANYLELFEEAVAAGGPIYASRFTRTEILPYQTDAQQSGIVNKWRALCNLRTLFCRCRDDILVMQSSAVATAFLGIALLRPRVRKLFMIQYNTAGVNSPFKRLLYRFASKYIDGIICPSEEIGRAYGRPYCIVPDYICSQKQEAPELPYGQKRYDFCMVGLICPDKGIVGAARVLAGTPHRVLIAGRAVTPDIADELREIAASCTNIELRLKYLSEEEYAAAICDSRYCVLNYSGAYSEHSSGVVYDILFRGVPVVGRRCQSLQFIEDTQTGCLFSDISEWSPASLLREEVYRTFRDRIARYKESHCEHRKRLAQFLTRGE